MLRLLVTSKLFVGGDDSVESEVESINDFLKVEVYGIYKGDNTVQSSPIGTD